MDRESILNSVVKFLVSFFGKNGPEVSISIPIPMEIPKAATPPPPPHDAETIVDWSNPECKISKHFTVKEATYLNSWHTYHHPTDDQKEAILQIAEKMDAISAKLAEITGKEISINVHAWIRPAPAICPNTPWDGQDYNRYIYETQVWIGLTAEQKALKHVPLSPHRTGHAVDFHVIGYEGPEGCAKIRAMILPHLEEMGLRMEDLNGGWVHLDNLPVVHERFFKP
jgi:hypothetical protein